MKVIHLIQKDQKLRPTSVASGSKTYESGFWAMPIEQAKKLIGGDIFFHEKQTSPSFFGGVISDCWIQQDGEWKGRVVFKFDASIDHKDKYPKNPEGWDWVKNIDTD